MMKKIGFGILVFLFVFAVPVAVYSIVTRNSDFDTRERAADSVDESGNTYRPQVLSVPTTEVTVGESYSYKMRAVDDDGDSLEYSAKEYPSWMMWREDMQVLEGVPSAEDTGSHRVELMVTDGTWVESQVFEVAVTEEQTEMYIEEVEEPPSQSEDSSEQESSVLGADTTTGSSTGFPTPDTADTDNLSSGDPEGGYDPEDYGFVPIGQADSRPSAVPVVLGEATTLPNTASFRGVVGLSLGTAIVAVGLFLWADVRWGISERFFALFQYERGEQIGLDMGNGVTVKKRKVRL